MSEPAEEPVQTGAGDDEIVLRAQGLRKSFGRGDTAVDALDDISVDFESGRFTAIMGPSGSGGSHDGGEASRFEVDADVVESVDCRITAPEALAQSLRSEDDLIVPRAGLDGLFSRFRHRMPHIAVRVSSPTTLDPGCITDHSDRVCRTAHLRS